MIGLKGILRGRGLVIIVVAVEHSNRSPTNCVELTKTHEIAYSPVETGRLADFLFLEVSVQLLSLIHLIGKNTFMD
ncbi:hypothetical protein TNCV_3962171 [Trichonephila clavipes]|nr:hypothetical protein TNCV_3962171 [Trichonephila clavipes]